MCSVSDMITYIPLHEVNTVDARCYAIYVQLADIIMSVHIKII